MYLATTLEFDLDKPEQAPKWTSFTTQEGDAGWLVTLIGRYMRLINDINKTNIQYRLISVTDLSASLLITSVEILDVINVSANKITELRSQKMQMQGGYAVTINSNAQALLNSMSDTDLGINGDKYYTLAVIRDETSPEEIKGMNPIVYALAANFNKDFYLDFVIRDDGSKHWLLTNLTVGKSESLPGICYLVQNEFGIFRLSATKNN